MIEVVWLAQFVAHEVWSVLPAFAIGLALGTLIQALQFDGLLVGP